jgi:hypothetical protein
VFRSQITLKIHLGGRTRYLRLVPITTTRDTTTTSTKGIITTTNRTTTTTRITTITRAITTTTLIITTLNSLSNPVNRSLFNRKTILRLILLRRDWKKVSSHKPNLNPRNLHLLFLPSPCLKLNLKLKEEVNHLMKMRTLMILKMTNLLRNNCNLFQWWEEG